MPVVCRNGSLNSTLIDRQNWIAVSENTGGRPGRPSCGANQVIPLSSQTSKDRASSARRCSWTSSSCDSGRVRASACGSSNRMDSHCESSTSRVVQQRRYFRQIPSRVERITRVPDLELPWSAQGSRFRHALTDCQDTHGFYKKSSRRGVKLSTSFPGSRQTHPWV